MHALLPNIAESALVGFVIGLVLGFATGHFVLALIPALISAAVFGVARLGVGWLTEEIETRRR